jgi:3-mercaptopyruvate sulfurtransferase SseA
MFRKLSVFLLLLVLSACSTAATQIEATTQPTPAATPTASPQSPAKLPATDAEVPRVSLEDARAAVESGDAIVVDVRSDAAYAVSHIPKAINIPLSEIESNPTGLNLDKDQWIITYCT